MVIFIRALSSSSSRPRTPPSLSSYSSSRNTSTPPSRKPYSTIASSVPHSTDTGLAAGKYREWTMGEDKEDEEVNAQLESDFNADEDEFGLPSLAASRQKARRGGGPGHDVFERGTYVANNSSSLLGAEFAAGRARANSSDIAEERGAPSYPVARKSEGKILRPQYKDILRGLYVLSSNCSSTKEAISVDPANSLHLISHPSLLPNASAKQIEALSMRVSRINKFKRILQVTSISMTELRASAWSGIPEEVRSISWQVLLGYLPTSSERRVATLERKRKEYLDGVKQAFEKSGSGLVSPLNSKTKGSYTQGRSRGLDENVWHQISIDVPRTSPHIELYGYEATQRSLERILYLWAIRHPASGYVQGINDLVTPFWQVFLGTYITDSNIESGMDPGQLPKSVLDAVEADSFWCLTKLLDGIQDNYIIAQPGIVRQVNSLRDLTIRIDSSLAKHLEQEGVEFMQFSFRWMNCLLMREVSVNCTIRMWDTYMAEEQGFSDFHLYVCAAFLVKWTERLVKMDFQVY